MNEQDREQRRARFLAEETERVRRHGFDPDRAKEVGRLLARERTRRLLAERKETKP
jgi:hypothetical protein